MKTKESQQQINTPMVDVRQRLNELRAMHSQLAVLRNELFEACCSFQHDPSSLDPMELSVLAGRLRVLEEKSEHLESAIVAIQSVRAVE